MKVNLNQSSTHRRVISWGLIILYTLFLPSAILVYRKLESLIGQQATGRIPLFAVISIGLVYSIYGFNKKRNLTHLLYLIPSVIISYIIIRNEANPNKHIHIPEYVLMAWLLYAALSNDYQGKGIFILIFICGSLLGVVDELEQGVHPRRFYGWSDMAINSSASLIGIFTIVGLTEQRAGDWAWRQNLKEFKGLVGLIAFGAVGAIIMCIYLFQVQALEKFWGVYPVWLLVWNIIFIIAAAGMEIHRRKNLHPRRSNETKASEHPSRTAQLWVYPPLAIIVFMHLIIVFVAITGTYFR